MKNRPLCEIEGCENLATTNGRKKDGSFIYKKLCRSHHKKKYNMPSCSRDKRPTEIKKLLHSSECFICGWDKAECDVHRIVYGCDGGKYIKGNVLPVCPNCHRLIHRGLLKIK